MIYPLYKFGEKLPQWEVLYPLEATSGVFVQRNNVFRIIIFYRKQVPEFPIHGFLLCDSQCDLNVDLFPFPLCNKINFFFLLLSDQNIVTNCSQMKINCIFDDLSQVKGRKAGNRISQTNIVEM